MHSQFKPILAISFSVLLDTPAWDGDLFSHRLHVSWQFSLLSMSKTFLDYPYFLLCFHKIWYFSMKFPWNSLFCWYLSLSLHIPTNKDGKFYGKIKFKTESFGDEDWGKYCCPCQGTCIHHNQILCIWPGIRNRQNIFHLQEQRGKDIHNHQKIIMANNVEVIIKSLYTWKSLSNQSSR